jgi:hypothetical protein
MDDRELVDALHYLGIDERNCRVVALLPLARVAWADGGVQDAERAAILQIATEGGFVDAETERTLRGWLTNAPSDAYFDRGSQVIVALAKRGGGLDSRVDVATIDAVLVHCETIARAAGGLFGLAFAVTKAERQAISSIAKALAVDPTDVAWTGMSKELD